LHNPFINTVDTNEQINVTIVPDDQIMNWYKEQCHKVNSFHFGLNEAMRHLEAVPNCNSSSYSSSTRNDIVVLLSSCIETQMRPFLEAICTVKGIPLYNISPTAMHQIDCNLHSKETNHKNTILMIKSDQELNAIYNALLEGMSTNETEKKGYIPTRVTPVTPMLKSRRQPSQSKKKEKKKK